MPTINYDCFSCDSTDTAWMLDNDGNETDERVCLECGVVVRFKKPGKAKPPPKHPKSKFNKKQ